MSLILLAIFASMLAGATLIEKYHGTVAAKDLIYHSPALFIILMLLAVNFILSALNHGYFKSKRAGLVLTHTGFIIIMTGAVVSHFFAEEGTIYLHKGEMTDCMYTVDREGKIIWKELPFSIYLDEFVLKRYPGSRSPSSYESFVTIHSGTEQVKAHIFMNNTLDFQGYRLYQSSYDEHETGSILSVSHDTCGRMLTYIGYFVLFLGLILSLTDKRGRFRQLYGKLKAAAVLPVFMLSAFSQAADAAERIPYIIEEEHAALFGGLAIQSADGRMMPVNTFSSEVLRKIYKEDRINGMNSDQFLLSLMLTPDYWSMIPCICVNNKELAARYDLDIPHSSYVRMFDSFGNYKFQNDVEEIYRKNPSERTRTEKDLLKLDERINIFNQLASHRMLDIFPLPDDPDRTWYAPGDDHSSFVGKDSMFVSRIFDWYIEEVSSAVATGEWDQADKIVGMIGTYQHAKSTGVDISKDKLQAEMLYNRLNPFYICRILYLIFGAAALLLALLSVFGALKIKRIISLPVCIVLISFLIHTAGMGMRWYIGGHAPWTNSYETMIYVSWATILAGLVFLKRNRLVFSLASVFGGIILFVSSMIWKDPQITTLVPVLNSPWLTFHVAVIVAAYGFLGLSCLIGIINLTLISITSRSTDQDRLTAHVQEMSILNEMSLWIGLVLLTVGTFLGAIWADVSWGRYWGWDPKETWALITILAYTAVTHIHLLKGGCRPWLFNLLSVIAFLSVLMTFFGVNYLLGGMHSYI